MMSSVYWRHSVNMCVRSVPQVVQIGFSSFVMRYPCVNRGMTDAESIGNNLLSSV